jgi:dihydrofolate synthase/folylpolyglutamate synthase
LPIPRREVRATSRYRAVAAAAVLGLLALVEMIPRDWELWLDGGHNPGAAEVLAAAVSNWRDRPLYLVTGMLNIKPPASSPRSRRTPAPSTPSPSPARRTRCPPPQSPPQPIRSASRPRSPPVATSHISAITADPTRARILICGSLHLAGAVLGGNG